MAHAHVWVEYVPDGKRSVAALESVIEASGFTVEQAAYRTGYTPKHFRAVLQGKKAFPPAPEFVALVVQALLPRGTSKAPADPGSFPGYAAWAEAHPRAQAVVFRLAGCTANDMLIGIRAPATGEEAKPSRQRFRELLDAHDLKRSPTYWNNVLRGHTRFPVDPAEVRKIADVLKKMDGKEAETAFHTPDTVSAELGQSVASRLAGDLEILCRLADDRAMAVFERADPVKAERPLREVNRALLRAKPRDKRVGPLLTAIRYGRHTVRSLAQATNVDAGRLARLLLGLEELTEANLKVIWAARQVALGRRKSRLLEMKIAPQQHRRWRTPKPDSRPRPRQS